MSVQKYPLSWPEGWKRTTVNNRKRAAFNRKETVRGGSAENPTSWNKSKTLSIWDGVTRVRGELSRMGVEDGDLIISTNVPVRLDGMPRSDRAEPQDPGVAVYWRADEKAPMRCMAVDRYDRVADNLAAIAATLEAMRAIERHGGAEILNRAFTGFAALPQHAEARPWREVLGYGPDQLPELANVEKRYIDRVREAHHDAAGGNEDRMRDLNVARDQARAELGGK